MKTLDQKRKGWIDRNRNLLDWLVLAEERVRFGHIIINYHAGRVTSYDLCPRERTEAEK